MTRSWKDSLWNLYQYPFSHYFWCCCNHLWSRVGWAPFRLVESAVTAFQPLVTCQVAAWLMPECKKVPLSCTVSLPLPGILQDQSPLFLWDGLLGTIAMPVNKEGILVIGLVSYKAGFFVWKNVISAPRVHQNTQ